MEKKAGKKTNKKEKKEKEGKNRRPTTNYKYPKSKHTVQYDSYKLCTVYEYAYLLTYAYY